MNGITVQHTSSFIHERAKGQNVECFQQLHSEKVFRYKNGNCVDFTLRTQSPLTRDTSFDITLANNINDLILNLETFICRWTEELQRISNELHLQYEHKQQKMIEPFYAKVVLYLISI